MVGGDRTREPELIAVRRVPAVGNHPAPALRPALVDDAAAPGPGQMTRGAFMAVGEMRVRAAVGEELRSVGRTAEDCPYLDYWIARFAAKPTEVFERSVVLYARPATRTAEGLLEALVERVRWGVRQWRAGETVDLPDEASAEPASVGSVVQRAGDAGAPNGYGEAGRAAKIQRRLGPGAPLDSGVKARMEGLLGAPLGDVRIHSEPSDAALAAGERARAVTVGTDVVLGAGFEAGTRAGDLLLAHELAHTVQQRGGSPGARSADDLEQEADDAALAAVSGRPAPRVRSTGALTLQACRERKAVPPSLLARLRDERDFLYLAEQLSDASEAELDTLSTGATPASPLAVAVEWERAFRGRRWGALAALARTGSATRLHAPYGRRLVELVVAGSVTLRIASDDAAFAEWARTRLEDLASLPTGFRLLVELLATGQPITLKKTTKGDRRTAPAGASEEAGMLRIFDDARQLLPRERQTRSAPVGSVVELNPDAAPLVFPGGEPGRLQPIGADPMITLGHELIHALHFARGEAIPNPLGGLIPIVGTINPVTGGQESVGELVTITGRREYEVTGTMRSFAVTTDISENALRAELGVPPRLAHLGIERDMIVNLTGTETLDAVVARYKDPDGKPVAGPLKDAVRRVVLSWYPESTFPTKTPVALPLPTPSYISLHLSLVEGNASLGDEADMLSGP